MKINKTATLETDIATLPKLAYAHKFARRGKGHYKEVQETDADLENRLKTLRDLIISRKYKTSAYIHVPITERGKTRVISKVPYWPDRVAQAALILGTMETFEDQFSFDTHAAIPGRGVHTALSQVRQALITDPEGTQYCLKLDVSQYFPSVSHAILKAQIARLFRDEGIRWMFAEVIDSMPGTRGIPIGNYTSQYLANIYLAGLDHFAKNTLKIPHYTRYMDDIVIFGASAADLRRTYREIAWYLQSRLFLDVKGNWQIFPVSIRGVDFSGYRIWPDRILLRKSTFYRSRKACFRIRRLILTNGDISKRQWSVIASYMGWAMHCTPKVRYALYDGYFRRILDLLPPDSYKIPGGREIWLKYMQ